jgi:hypothetical protein
MIRILVAVLISFVMFSSVAVSQTSEEAISLDKVFCYRQVDKQGNNLTVTLLINTKGLEREKTLKLKEKFPTGFQAKVTKPYGSAATVTETGILFVWSNLPPSDLFAVSYELTSLTPLNESVLINGNMSFLSEAGIKYVSINQRDFLNDKDIASRIKNLPPYNPPAPNTTTASNTKSTTEIVPLSKSWDTVAPPKPILRTTVKEEPVKKTVAETKPVQKQEPVKETAQNVENNQAEIKPVSPVEPIKETSQNIETKPVTPVEPIHKQEPVKQTVSENNNITEVKPVSTTQPSVTKTKPKPAPVHTEESSNANIAGVYYAVQIGATPKKLPSGFFAKYNFNKTIDENMIDGMYKYSLGQFSTLKEATNYQNYVKQKNVQCFIVAYSNGKKISIKEALAASKQ